MSEILFKVWAFISSLIGPVWWKGEPTKLVKKTTLIERSDDNLPVYTLTFEAPEDAEFVGGAIKHDDVRVDMGDFICMCVGDFKPRAYSPTRVHGNQFDITFKVYPGGVVTEFLEKMKVGDEINSFGRSAGHKRNPGSYLGMVAFGVGITEILPVAESELEKGDVEKVVVLWASRTMGDTFWHDRIEALKEKYPENFSLVYLLSREEVEGCIKGRISPEVFKQVFQPESKENARFLSVGTMGMMWKANKMFGEIGFPMSKHALFKR